MWTPIESLHAMNTKKPSGIERPYARHSLIHRGILHGSILLGPAFSGTPNQNSREYIGQKLPILPKLKIAGRSSQGSLHLQPQRDSAWFSDLSPRLAAPYGWSFTYPLSANQMVVYANSEQARFRSQTTGISKSNRQGTATLCALLFGGLIWCETILAKASFSV